MQRVIKSKIRFKSDPSGNVINLSKHLFSLDTLKRLNKNINFVPTPKKDNKKQLDNDAENFFRLIKLRAHFKNINPKSNIDQENLPFQIKNKQKWKPKDTHRNVSTFVDLVQNDLNKEKTQKMKNPKPNVSKGEQKATEGLAKRKDIIITNADKGGAVVIMDVEKYIKEANRQLSDKHNYKALQEGPTLQHSNSVNHTNDRFKKENLLSKKLAEGLKSVNPKPPKFYISPNPRYIKRATQEDQL